MSEKQWDVFISYASEDKATVARPLADALHRAGVKVWLDEHELQIGDSLSEKIDAGLSESYFGIVIFSPDFFAKHWPKKELAGLRAREEEGHKVILPVWHNVDKVAVRKFSPILADIVAGSTEYGIDAVVKAIVRAVFSSTSRSPSSSSPSYTRAMLTILNEKNDRREMVEFIKSLPYEVRTDLLGAGRPFEPDLTIEMKLGDVEFDFLSIYSGHGVMYTWTYFSEYWKDPYLAGSESRVLDEVKKVLLSVKNAQIYFYKNWREINFRLISAAHNRGLLYTGYDEVYWLNKFENEEPGGRFQIFCGRRADINRTDERTIAWGELRKKFNMIDIRSYDAVLDILADVDAR